MKGVKSSGVIEAVLRKAKEAQGMQETRESSQAEMDVATSKQSVEAAVVSAVLERAGTESDKNDTELGQVNSEEEIDEIMEENGKDEEVSEKG